MVIFTEEGEVAVKIACMWWGVRDSGLDDGAGRRKQHFPRPDSLEPE